MRSRRTHIVMTTHMTAPEPTLNMNDDDLILQRYGWSVAPTVGSERIRNDDSVDVISVGILSYNRREDLRRTLTVISQVAADKGTLPLQILVVDNNSSDGTVAMVQSEFPHVECIALMINTGTAGRNEFITRARGRYIFCFDDDSVPATPDTIPQIVNFMDEHPEVSMLSTRVLQPRTGIDETDGFENMGRRRAGAPFYNGLYAFGCACCMRRSDILRVGSYADVNLWGAEGIELALRMYQQGLTSVWHPEFLTLHFKQWKNRPKQAGAYWAVQNRIAVYAAFFPIYFYIPLLAAYLLRRVLEIALHPGRTSDIIRAIVRGIALVPTFRRRHGKLRAKQILNLGPWYYSVVRW